jgi:hypothetical protein
MGRQVLAVVGPGFLCPLCFPCPHLSAKEDFLGSRAQGGVCTLTVLDLSFPFWPMGY